MHAEYTSSCYVCVCVWRWHEIHIQQYKAFYFLLKLHINTTKPATERVQALADIRIRRYTHLQCIRLKLTYAYVVTATKPVHRLQIRPIVHNGRHRYHSPSYIRVCAVVWECGEGQTDRQTHRRPWPIYILPGLSLMRNVTKTAASARKCKTRIRALLLQNKHVTYITSATITAQLYVITILTHISHQYRPRLDTICLPNNKQYQKINTDKQTN